VIPQTGHLAGEITLIHRKIVPDVCVLGRDPEQVTVKMILDALKRESDEEQLPVRDTADREVDRLLAKMEEEQDGSAYNLSLREIVRRADRRELDTGAALVEEPGVQPS